jgi:outer membrane protein assembly factor BamB
MLIAVGVMLGQDTSPTFHHDQQRTGRTANLGPTEPVLRWTFKTQASLDASPVIAPDGTIYLASTDNHLYSLTPSGMLNWTFAANESVFSTPALGSDGTIYFGDLSGRYYAVNPNGSLRWSHALSGGAFERRVIAAPAVAPSGQSFIGGWNDHFYSFGQDGTLLWEVALEGEGQITAAPVLDSAGNVYLATLDPSNKSNIAVIKFDSRGNFLWKSTDNLGIDRNRIISSPAIDSDRGRLYVGASRSDDGCLYAFNLSDGKQAFRTFLPKGIVSSPALAGDGTIYVGCMDGKLYALDPVNGSQRWSFTAGAYFVIGSPSVDGAGRIYVGDSDGVIHALFPSGSELWNYSTQSNIASAPVIAGDHTLYVTSYDSTLYAIGQARRPRTRLK